MRNTGSVQAVDRALQILQSFTVPDQEFGVGELASRLGVHKSTVSRLAATLAARGFLARAPGGDGFCVGPELGRLGLLAHDRQGLVEVARSAMERLAEETGETVNLAVLDGEQAVNVAQVEGKHIVGVGLWTGRRTPLHCAANGKVLLAFGPAPFPNPLERVTVHTITAPEALRRELARVRRRGFALNVGELEEGLHAVAVPITGADGGCRAALSVSGPAYRLPAPALPRLAARCQDAAAEIEALLGRPARAA
jgi:DNA-binding IclR family transcriptional regulator